MSIAPVVAAVALAAVFAAAGIGKLLDRNGSRAAGMAFGVPRDSPESWENGLPLHARTLIDRAIKT